MNDLAPAEIIHIDIHREARADIYHVARYIQLIAKNPTVNLTQ